MFKSVLVFAVLCSVVNVLANPLNSKPFTLEEVTVIALEEPCVRQGGMCMRSEHCEPDYMVQLADLCPKQSHFGVICCYFH